MNRKTNSALSDAARSLEQEIERLDELLNELSHPVNSEKTLQRASQALAECSACEERLASHLRNFATAMQSFQERQQSRMEALNQSAQRLQSRNEERAGLLERVADLGRRAREISEPFSRVSDDSWQSISPELLASVREVSNRIDQVVADASAVAASAKEANWVDIARDADSLRQQLQDAKNRILLGERKLVSRAPS